MKILIEKLKCKVLLWLAIKKIILFFSRKEQKYDKFVKKIKTIDSIENYGLFKETIQEMLFSDKIQRSRRSGNEGQFYGYYDSLIKYANSREYKITLIPGMEHGIRFSSAKWICKKEFMCYACQGKKRINEIHQIDPWKPVFVMGPYIYYTKPYYSDNKFDRLKKKYGKILLVFPSHTCEGERLETERERSFVDLIYSKYANFFDTIMVCIYWHDVNDSIMEQFRKKGAKLVSAGFRGDSNFIRRLKTIIQFADTVVVDSIGTNIGYCICMGKNVYMEGEQSIQLNDIYYTNNYLRFKRAFYSSTLFFTQEQIKLQKELYTEFWGGEECIWSVNEMKMLFELLEEICHNAHYDTKRIPKVIQEKLNLLKYSNYDSDKIKYVILKNAVAKSV